MRMRITTLLYCVVTLGLLERILAQRRRGNNRQNVFTTNVEPDQCLYTFTVSPSQIRDSCRTAEVEELIDELKASNDDLKKQNDNLKKDIQSIRDDYQNMVDSVSILEAETSTWREIIEWPKLDPRFEPENDTVVFVTDPTYVDCWEAKEKAADYKQGIYNIEPEESVLPFFGYCDEEGWNVFQRRFGEDSTEEPVDFFKGWSDYSGGFGRLSGEFWLGLENLHLLTAQNDYELRVELVGWNNKFYTSNYDNFRIQSETVNYAFDVGNYTSGNYKDVLTDIKGLPFSTFDNDNDDWPSANCANYYRGGWWLNQCGFDPHRTWCQGTGCMSWGEKNVKKSIMKLRPMSAKGQGEKVKKKSNRIIKIKKVRRRRPTDDN